MDYESQYKSISTALTQSLRSLKWLGQSLLLGTTVSIFFTTSASAIQTVTLTFNEEQVSVSFSDFQEFVRTGKTEREGLQQFFQRLPRTSEFFRNLLMTEIVINSSLANLDFNNPAANFLLIQLRSALVDSLRSSNQSPLRTALAASYRNDGRISLLELMENYPQPEVSLEFPRLERAYNRVVLFVERVQPAFEAGKQKLQALICECGTIPAASITELSQADSFHSAAPMNSVSSDLQAQSFGCLNNQTLTSAIASSDAANLSGSQIGSPWNTTPEKQGLKELDIKALEKLDLLSPD